MAKKNPRKLKNYIGSIRGLVSKALRGDNSASEILLRKCEGNEKYRQIVKRVIDSLNIKNQKARFAKVDYRKESRKPAHWPIQK